MTSRAASSAHVLHIRVDSQHGQLCSGDGCSAANKQVRVGLVDARPLYTCRVQYDGLRERGPTRVAAVSRLDHVRSISPGTGGPTLLPLLRHACAAWTVKPKVIIGTRTKLDDGPFSPLVPPPPASLAVSFFTVLPVPPRLLLSRLVHGTGVERIRNIRGLLRFRLWCRCRLSRGLGLFWLCLCLTLWNSSTGVSSWTCCDPGHSCCADLARKRFLLQHHLQLTLLVP